MPTSTKRLIFKVAPLGTINSSAADNAISLANNIQKAFYFQFHPEIIPVKDKNFLLSNGAFDLDKAARNLIKRKNFSKFVGDRLILLTSKPYSNQDLLNQYAGKKVNLKEQCYFYDTEAAKNVALVSTYIWDHLPRMRGLPSTVSGQRALEPYLIYTLGMIALDRCVAEIHHHETIRGCPLDYCENVRDINRFFTNGRFCDDCERDILKKNVKEGKITTEQVDAIKRILKAAVGRAYDYDFAISFAGSERKLAHELASLLREARIRVFYDNFYLDELAGKNLTDFFDEIYRKSSRYCIIFVSREYKRKMWPNEERQKAQARAREEIGSDYIIPILVEYADLSGLLETTGYLSLSEHSIKKIAQILTRKIPMKSH
jgi:hypothetical protein